MDKYINKIHELKKENIKLKKYKIFVEKNKNTKSIYSEIENLQNEKTKFEILKQDFSKLNEENNILKSKILKFKESELSFANKNKFYSQQIEINNLKENIIKLEKEKKQIYEDHRDTFKKNKDMQIIIDRLKNIFNDVNI